MNGCSNNSYDYEIKVRGHLSGRLAAVFGDLKLQPIADGCTVISATDMDQAALFGILMRIRDCGLPLVEVVRKEPASGSELREIKEQKNG